MIVSGLKEIADAKGPKYILDYPYEVYLALTEKNIGDKKVRAAILYVLASGMLRGMMGRSEAGRLSEAIQKECSLNKDMADCLADIFSSFYSPENTREWREKKNMGLEEFLRNEFSVKWEGFAVWSYSGGSISCHYNGDMVFAVCDDSAVKEEISSLINENPFVTREEICRYYERKLSTQLDWEFDDYCTCDKYYEPVVEDFCLDDCVEDWCAKNGMRMISCDGHGYDDGYDPDF